MREAELFTGLTVLSLEQATVLPYLTYRFAQDGMRVIRLEDPVRGDPNRSVGENRLGEERMNTYFLPINAGKKAITLNLSQPRGREMLHELIRRLDVDIFCANQLPKSYAKLGIDYDTMRGVKPDLIWLGVTGFGPTSNEAAYDPVLQARSGMMDLTGEAGGPPMVTGIPFIDMGASEHAYGLVMRALYQRAVTGEGSRIDLSMLESAVSWMTVPVTLTTSFGQVIRRHGNRHEFFAPVSVYQTRDGYVYLAVGSDRQWENLVSLPAFRALARPEYAANAGRIADRERLNEAIGEITRALTTAGLTGLLQQAQIPVSPVRTVAAAVEDPFIKEKLLFSHDQRTGCELVLAPPPHMPPYMEARGRRLSFPPRMGEHNAEIYGDALGLDGATLAELRREQVI